MTRKKGVPRPLISTDQLADLCAIAGDRRPKVPRRRVTWFVDNGYLLLGAMIPAPRGQRWSVGRYALLTAKACAVTGIATGTLPAPDDLTRRHEVRIQHNTIPRTRGAP